MLPDQLTPIIDNPVLARRRQQPQFYNNLLLTALAPPFRQLHWPNPVRRSGNRAWLLPAQYARLKLPEPIPVPVGYQPAPVGDRAPSMLSDAATARWVRQVADAANNMLRGKLNATALLTLTANAASTTITDSRISAFSAILFSPLTADAATEYAAGTMYVSSQMGGQAVVTHANNAQTDRQFRLLVIG